MSVLSNSAASLLLLGLFGKTARSCGPLVIPKANAWCANRPCKITPSGTGGWDYLRNLINWSSQAVQRYLSGGLNLRPVWEFAWQKPTLWQLPDRKFVLCLVVCLSCSLCIIFATFWSMSSAYNVSLGIAKKWDKVEMSRLLQLFVADFCEFFCHSPVMIWCKNLWHAVTYQTIACAEFHNSICLCPPYVLFSCWYNQPTNQPDHSVDSDSW